MGSVCCGLGKTGCWEVAGVAEVEDKVLLEYELVPGNRENGEGPTIFYLEFLLTQ